jgi:hypothetical protein
MMVTFADVVDHANPSIQPVLLHLRGRIRGLGRMGEKVTSKTRISYEVERDFCEVRVQRERRRSIAPFQSRSTHSSP